MHRVREARPLAFLVGRVVDHRLGLPRGEAGAGEGGARLEADGIRLSPVWESAMVATLVSRMDSETTRSNEMIATGLRPPGA
jgi:hypothetical protein